MFTKQEWGGQKFFFPNTLREWNTLPDYILEEQFTEIVLTLSSNDRQFYVASYACIICECF